jgi:hypothetical protein
MVAVRKDYAAPDGAGDFSADGFYKEGAPTVLATANEVGKSVRDNSSTPDR